MTSEYPETNSESGSDLDVDHIEIRLPRNFLVGFDDEYVIVCFLNRDFTLDELRIVQEGDRPSAMLELIPYRNHLEITGTIDSFDLPSVRQYLNEVPARAATLRKRTEQERARINELVVNLINQL